MICKKCGIQIPIDEGICPSCGESQDSLVQLEIFSNEKGVVVFERGDSKEVLSFHPSIPEATVEEPVEEPLIPPQPYTSTKRKKEYLSYKLMLVLILIMLMINGILAGALRYENAQLTELQNQRAIKVQKQWQNNSYREGSENEY